MTVQEDQEFDNVFEALIHEMEDNSELAVLILGLGDINVRLREYLNNDVLSRIEADKEERDREMVERLTTAIEDAMSDWEGWTWSQPFSCHTPEDTYVTVDGSTLDDDALTAMCPGLRAEVERYRDSVMASVESAHENAQAAIDDLEGQYDGWANDCVTHLEAAASAEREWGDAPTWDPIVRRAKADLMSAVAKERGE